MHFIRKLTVFNRGNNWAVVTPIYKNWLPTCPYHVRSLNIFVMCLYSN